MWKLWQPDKKNLGLCHRGQVTLFECCHVLLGVKYYSHTFLHQSLLLESQKLRRDSPLFGTWLVFT